MTLRTDGSFASVLGEIVGNIQHIVRAEVRLAHAELRDEMKKITGAGAMFVVAAVAAVLGLGVLLLAAVYALALVMASWAAALVVGVATLTVAAICAAAGTRRLRNVTLPPPKTMASIEETFQWARTRAK